MFKLYGFYPMRSAADINIGYVLNQARARGLVPPDGQTDRYLDRIGDRPASTIPEQRAYDEGNP
jgi:hypothetical protein